MKTLTTHINEALKIGKNLSSFSTYSCQPKTAEELINIINIRIKKDGPNCDLNDIDISLITDMFRLFWKSRFNGDISKWDVSNVTNMGSMFAESDFNGDISKWDVSNVNNMWGIFYKSKFNQDISNWKINKDCVIYNMFNGCPIRDEYKPKGIK